MPTPPSDYGTPHHLAPKSLFMTPQSSRQHDVYSTPQTPSLDNISDVDSLSVSSEQTLISSMTPDMSNLSLGRGRGRPWKKLVKPTFDDFPIDALEAEQK